MSEQRQQPPVWRVHWEVALMFRERGIIEMRAGRDLIGAELLWGAVARATKAVAERRGWRHGKHGQLFTVARRLSAERGSEGMIRWFGDASSLHIHFYEGPLESDEFDFRLESVNRIIAIVASLLGESNPSEFG